MSINNDEETVCGKIMRLTKLDADTCLRVVQILHLNPDQKKKNLSYGTIEKWRSKYVLEQDEMRQKMRLLGIPYKSVERVLFFMLDTPGHIFPQDMHQKVDEFHAMHGFAPYMQCNAKCTTCEVPCRTSDDFIAPERPWPPLSKAESALEKEIIRQKCNPLFSEKLMQELAIDKVTALELLDTMDLKYSVTWENMQQEKFGQHWWAYSWRNQNIEKLDFIQRTLLGPQKTKQFQDLLQQNVHQFEGPVSRKHLGVDFNEHNLVASTPKMAVDKPKYHKNKPPKAGHQSGPKPKKPPDAKDHTAKKTPDAKDPNTKNPSDAKGPKHRRRSKPKPKD